MLQHRYKTTIYFIILFSFFSVSSNNAEAKEKDFYINKAKEIISEKNDVPKEKLKVANERPVSYQFSGKKAHSVKFIDGQGKIIGLTLDENGQELIEDELVKQNLEAKHAKYGKFDPSFFEKLSKEPEDKKVKAILTLNVPTYEPISFPEAELPDNGSNIKQEQLDELVKKSRDQYIANLKPITDSAIEKLKAKGYDIKDSSTLGILSVELSLKQLEEVQKIDEIDGITDGSLKNIPLSASARSATGIVALNNRGFNGTGVKVAQIEAVGGRLPTNNPNLPMTGITQDTTYVCPNPNDHAAHVAGILKSTNLANLGTATGINLWASGSCSGNDDELYNRTLEAGGNQNNNVINFSIGCRSGCLRYPDLNIVRGYDNLVYQSTHPSLIVAAGNHGTTAYGGDGTGNIYKYATAYNVLTVGSYDDKNNANISDDSMSDFSSWQNPTSGHNDREKPELVAPGTNIRSTGNSSALREDSGTSFATPVVTGGSALLMQRSYLLKSEPEALKALLLATARNDVAKDGQMPTGDSKDGYGGVDFDWADKLLQGQTGGQVVINNHNCATMPSTFTIPMSIGNTQPHRVFFTWRVDPGYSNYSNEPNMDMDISVYDPNGNFVGSSSRWDSNIEGVYFVPSVSGVYSLNVSRYRCDAYYNHTRYAAAWSQVPVYNAEFYNNKTLSGAPVLTRKDDFINFDWGNGSPGPGVQSDNFSVRWTKTEHFNEGSYEFTAIGDDGLRLYVDNVLILDKWIDQGPTTYKVITSLTNGNHTIKFEYYENGGGAVSKLSYEKITPIVSGGIYRLINQCSGKVLDVSGGSTANGANVQQWGWANVNQQKWRVEDVGSGFYRLTAQHSNKVLEVSNAQTVIGANVWQWPWLGGTNQQWSIYNSGSEFSKLLARHSGLALDVYNASIDDGANVHQWVENGSCAQRWKLDRLQ